MQKASIDLGTNTCLLLAVEWDEHHRQVRKVIRDEATVVRLGEGVDQARMLQEKPMARTLACLKGYSDQIKKLGISPSDVICVATSQARDAKNGAEFFAKIQAETGFRFQVISGENEGRLTFLGALLPEMDPKNSYVMDIGGGSTELIALDHEKSIDIGSVRFSERFLKSNPVTDIEFWACQQAIDDAILAAAPSLPQRKGSQLVAVAGTATTLAAWHLDLPQFDSSQIDGLILSRGDIHRMVEDLKWRSIEERRLLPCMDPMRADVILAGALIMWRTMELLGFSECRVSTRGLRYGALLGIT